MARNIILLVMILMLVISFNTIKAKQHYIGVVSEDLEDALRSHEDALGRQTYLEGQVKLLEGQIADADEVLQWDVMEVEITHYAPLDANAVEGVCYSGDPNITASGARVQVGKTIAAGPSIPFGTKIYIPGYGMRVVQDRGGAITDNHIDIAIHSRAEAYRLGRKKVLVYIQPDVL